jgi:hypothetical protein
VFIPAAAFAAGNASLDPAEVELVPYDLFDVRLSHCRAITISWGTSFEQNLSNFDRFSAKKLAILISMLGMINILGDFDQFSDGNNGDFV